MNILGIYSGQHDACAVIYRDYEIIASVALERMTRKKIDGGRIPISAIEECLTIANLDHSDIGALALGNGVFPAEFFEHFPIHRKIEHTIRRVVNQPKNKSLERELVRYHRTDSENLINKNKLLNTIGLNNNIDIHYYNHHEAHALPSLFHTDWDEALLYTADGGGDNIQYSHRVYSNNSIIELYGSKDDLLKPINIDSVGLAYGFATQALGFKINRHEGKLTGLAAWGNPIHYKKIKSMFSVNADGVISSSFDSYKNMRHFLFDLFNNSKREDVAASIQVFLEETILESIGNILIKFPVKNLGLSGGVFANVRLNQRLVDELNINEIFIYPPMSDQGLASGGVLSYLLHRDGLNHWISKRYKLEHLYYGRNYNDTIDSFFSNHEKVKKISSNVAIDAANLIHEGKILAIYTMGMEFGPRALGARSIIAAPNDPTINDTLNKRLSRTEFMPFAPFVSEDDACAVFELSEKTLYAAKFMTITCNGLIKFQLLCMLIKLQDLK